ncbi:cell division protein FtsQ/DivIB [Serinicoccus kebangsaanensis]|uniref:cell division protein FtsQ/DivIB n=1 Tax=Serinicoccus kebangsaanensis TaxID=2602069 RepID=UPI00124C3A45|nr:FtsQ-type POTRA domain-containing protein [Serinicoccus kebangsaanensis]
MKLTLPWRRGAGPERRGGAVRRRMAGVGRRTLLTWTAVVLAAAAAMVFLFFFSAAFVVKDLQATGAREEVTESALQHAQIPHGRPLARVSEGRVSDRVLEDRRIAAVEVERDWPSSVTLVVTEREPAVALRGGGTTWLADASGVIYEQVDRPSKKLPLITLRSDPTELDSDTVTGLAELWRMRPDPDTLEGDLGAPAVGSDGSIEMDLGQVTLVWGSPTDNEKKWNVVTALIGQETIDPQGALAMTIDVRIPGTPVVTGLPEATG